MRRCEDCGVQVAGIRGRCPLCGEPLEKVPGEEREIYPKVPLLRKKYKKLLFPLFSVFHCLLRCCWYREFGFSPNRILVPDCFVWRSVSLVLLTNRCDQAGKPAKTAFFATLFLSALLLLLDLLTGWRGWSAGYGVPLLSTASMMALAVYYWGFRWEDHHIVQYVALDLLYSVVSAVLFFTGCAGVLWPSLLCMCMGVGSFLAVVLFRRKVILGQLHRGAHL